MSVQPDLTREAGVDRLGIVTDAGFEHDFRMLDHVNVVREIAVEQHEIGALARLDRACFVGDALERRAIQGRDPDQRERLVVGGAQRAHQAARLLQRGNGAGQIAVLRTVKGVNIGGNMLQRFGAMNDYFADRAKAGILPAPGDAGRFRVTHRPEYLHVFKVPGLRNVELTAPYFHNGAAATLDEAVEQYCGLTGRSSLPNLDWYFAYNQFRLAGILQGIAGRVRDGTASSPQAVAMAERVVPLAESALAFAQKVGA